MVTVRTLTRAAIVVLMGAGTALWYACADHPSDSLTDPPRPLPDLREVIAAQRRHTDGLLKIPGVVGTAVTILPDGRAGVQILLEHPDVRGLPLALDGIPVKHQVTGRFMAFSDPKTRQRPAPLGFSVGHPAITAGTIGARVRDATGHVYILSNNHVLANSNGATVGDPIYQPGVFDGGTAADQIATLSDFQTITFSATANNTMDAGIALSTPGLLDNASPADDAYGLPSATIYGDANGDGQFDDPNALLGVAVQKYGRTTSLTHGQITGVNATVSICYEVTGIFCSKSARFVDQLIISPAGFSDGGDSGSLIVTDDANLNPVALLFAGSATVTIANRIDLVLTRFGVAIDGAVSGPFTDVGVTSIGAPGSVVVDSTTAVTVTVRNLGNQNVRSSFDVILRDTTESVTVGTQSVAGLAAGASATLTFGWTPHVNGSHSLVANHSLTDDRPANNENSVVVAVGPPVTDVAVSSLSGASAVSEGQTINVAVTVANLGNLNVSGNFVVTLRDATDSVTIGSQTVTGLAVGGNATLNFSWNTTGATLGSHTLVAAHDLADDDAANNQRTGAVIVNPRFIDVALTSITGPASVNQGDTAHIGVTVQNVGEQAVGSFDVVLTDASFGGVIVATGTVTGLAVGAVATVDLPWNTAGAAVTGHTLIATQMLADGKSTNNARAIGILVKAPVNLVTDVAVSGLSTPGSVTKGATATIGVTVQNVGQQNVSASFDVVLTDSTAGVTLGTQTVTGLAVGASATLSFSWNTTSAALGSHTLVATHSLADGNAANNRRTAAVTVNPQVTDVALTNITGPARVNQGDTAHIRVTVQNVGQVAVSSSFNVVLNDATAGVTIGTQAVAGLAPGASATLDFPWNTAGVAVTGHTLIATQQLADGNSSNNAMAIGIIVNPPVILVTDVAVTAVSAPGSATSGQSVNVAVTVGNVGNQPVGSFVVGLQDATAGVTIGTQTVTGLAVGANATLTFTWNTTGAALGSHTLVATHGLTDANAANNQRESVVTVSAPVLVTDVAVTSVSAPAAVGQGNTATIGVTVQNVGQLDVGASFNVVLNDATGGGATIGTQTVTALTVGTSATLTFNWNTTGVALGNHTLVASHTLTDANAANNQRSAIVAVNPRIVDVALTSLTGPAAATQGDTVHFAVAVQNVGGQDVSTSFDVVLTDGGVTIGTQSVSGLAAGAVATLDFPWNTAAVAATGHTVIARHTLVDNNATNNSRAIGITVNAPSVHVGNLTGVAVSNGTTWSASVEITVHDHRHSPVNGATVRGSWGGPNTGECVTGAAGGNGTCTIVLALPNSTGLVSFAVTSLTSTGYVYKLALNHDPDGSSNGSTIFVRRP